ncbi:hypothetical protein BTS2_3299 [Bacillus sp. TS-2]|nr:hypothetical protein BTS2_3299 [Bacillus sp. TS-2]
MKETAVIKSIIEKRELTKSTITVINNGLEEIQLDQVLNWIEESPTNERMAIEGRLSEIERDNGDLMGYLTYLTVCYIEERKMKGLDI